MKNLLGWIFAFALAYLVVVAFPVAGFWLFNLFVLWLVFHEWRKWRRRRRALEGLHFKHAAWRVEDHRGL
jgi:hypothetical protein